MATQVQFRRGTTSQNNAFTGAQGELTIDTDVWTLRIHDGVEAGGHVVPTLTAVQTFTNKTFGSGNVWNGSAVSLAYGGTGASLSAVGGAIAYSTGSALALSLSGTAGQVLTSGGGSAPTWVNASSLSTGTATTATVATNIAGGSAGQMPYQSDTDTTAFITAGSTYQILQSNGSSTAPTWVNSLQNISSVVLTGTTDASSSTTGSFKTAGGMGIAKKLYVGTDLNVGGNTIITGNLTVNGTTTTINSTTYTVDDKNIELGSVDTPTNTTANGGGITLKGDTDKTIIWDSSNSNWTSSEHWNIASGKSFKIATVPVLTATTVLNDSSQTSIGIGGYATTVSIGASTGATTINNELDVTGNLIVNGDAQIKGGDLTVDSGTTTFNLINTNATTLNIGGAATAVNIGNATSATATIRPGTVVGSNTTQNLWNTTATTINLGGASTTTNIGSTSSGTTTVGYDLTVNGDVQVKGGDITTDQTTFNLLNTTATTINLGGASTTTNIGSTSSGTTTIGYDANIKHDLVVDGDVEVKGGDLTTNQTTFNLLNTTATTLNIGGAATTVSLGAATGTLTVNNAQVVFNSVKTIQIPVGTTAERPTAATGQIRYNTDLSTFEGYGGTAWGSLGGVKSVDGLTYILAETSAGASNDELEFYSATDGSTTAKRGGWNKTRLLSNTPILVTSNASLTSFPNAKIISSTGVTGDTHPYNAGVVGEGVASGSDTTIWGVGVYGVGSSNGATKSAGVVGDGHVSNTGDTGSAVGVRGYAVDTHAGGLNVGLYGTASGSSVGNYALWMEDGNINSSNAQTWILSDNNSAALSLDATGKTGILKIVTTNSAEGVTMSGTLGVTGDFKVNTNKFAVTASSGNTSIAGTLAVTGDQTNTGDLAVNGGDITTTATTATLFNTNATTLNVGGAATTLNIGSAGSGAAVNVGKDLYVAGNLYVTGTQSTGSISTISGADSAIYTNAGAVGNTNDIGLIGTYVSSGTKYAGLLKDHADSIWKFYSTSTAPTAGTTQDFTGATYDAVKMGALTATNGTFSAALTYGGVTLSNSVTGTGSMVLSASPTITGHITVEGVTATGATGTGKFVFDTSPTIAGHPTIEGVTSTGATGTGAFVFASSPSLTTPSLGVASATSINKVAITTPASGSTLTIADGKTLTASNTLTFTGTDSSTVAFGGGGTVAYVANKLSVFAATSSSELASVISDETGSGALVFANTPTLVTPTLGVATATSINKMAITAPATSSTLAVADGKTFTVNNTLTLSGTDSSTVAFGGGGTVVYTSNKLSALSSTSSSELAGVISDETGSGVLVFGTSPTFTTSIDSGATFGAFASSTALTLGYTGTGASSTTNISNAALSGSYTKTVNIGTGGTTGSTTAINLGSSIGSTTTVNGTLSIAGSSSGAVKFVAASAAGSVTYTLPSADAGASGYALTSNGSGTLSWTAVGASTASDDTTTASDYYPVFATATSGALSTVKVSSTKFTFKPSTGGLRVESFGVGTASSGTTGEIRATNAITSYYSDDKLKTRTGNIENALDKVLSLDGFHYHANETAVALGYDGTKQEVGLSAQQVQAILPEVIAPAPIDEQYLTIHYERLVPLLVEAIKEQQKQIEELKAKLGN